MGRLIEVLELYECNPGKRRPADFERRHGALESEIEGLLLLLPALAEALYEDPRRYGYVHRRPQISLRIERDESDNPGSATG
ncbi:hypothetical protein [Streptomyces sp. NPDC020747]|uniref:hypothetical protein n=1 Tax=Streptomyces sp. NPDC020747 TaxID=3365086 RepID=UPI0037A2C45B